MKRIFVVLILSLFIFFPEISDSQTTSQNCPKSFRGIKWGTKIDDLPDMNYWGYKINNKDVRIYTRTNDKMEIGDIKIKNIEYLFFKGRFYQGHIDFKGEPNYYKLKNRFESIYSSASESEDVWGWLSSKSKWEVTIHLYLEDCFSKWFCKGWFKYTYYPIFLQVNKDTGEKYKKDLE